MNKQSWLIAGGVVVAVVLAWFVLSPGSGTNVAVDLVEEFPKAARHPQADAFSVIDATINGVTKRAIHVKQSSRMIFTLTVPESAELLVNPGLLEDSWKIEGDGVLFRVLITANAVQDELLNLYLNPFGNPGERDWQEISLDLSPYAGETVELFFNTNNSPPTRPQRDDPNGDLAVWGAPRIVTR